MMIDDQLTDLLVQVVPIALATLACAIVAYKLAVEKGRNAVLWTILGLIPGLNVICLLFFIGATNRKLQQSLDDLKQLASSLGSDKKAP